MTSSPVLPGRGACGVAVCAGSSCRGRTGHSELVAVVADAGVPFELIRCVGICSGPVVLVAAPVGEPMVLRRVRSRKARRDLLRLLRGRALSERLERRLVRGPKRVKALRRSRPLR